MKREFSWHIIEKYSNIKFSENPSSGSRVVPYGRTDKQTNMTKLIVNFLIFSNAPKKAAQKLMHVRIEKVKCVWKEWNCFMESVNLNLAEIVCEVAAWTELL
jgi:hypothetical protein